MILNTGQVRLTAVYESYILTARKGRRTPVALQGHTGVALGNSEQLVVVGSRLFSSNKRTRYSLVSAGGRD